MRLPHYSMHRQLLGKECQGVGQVLISAGGGVPLPCLPHRIQTLGMWGKCLALLLRDSGSVGHESGSPLSAQRCPFADLSLWVVGVRARFSLDSVDLSLAGVKRAPPLASSESLG